MFVSNNIHPYRALFPAHAEYLIHLQPLRYLMGDEQHGNFTLELVDGLGEVLGGVLVEVGDGFVEDEYLGTFEQCAGNGDALTLAAGESGATLADLGLVAIWQFVDEVVDFGSFAGIDDVVEAGVGMRHDQVVVEGAREQYGFLRDDAVGLAQFVGGEVADVAAIELDLPIGGLVEAEQKFGQSILPWLTLSRLGVRA